MKRSKKILLIIAVVFSLAVYSCVSVAGASSTKDGLQISMTTDKESYTVNEAVNVNITVKNTNNYAVKNVSIESIVPTGLALKSGNTTKTIESLQANEELQLQFTAMLEKDSQTTTNPPPSNSNVKTNTDEQTKNNATNNSGSLKTGENNATLLLFSILFFISALLILYLVLIHKKKRTNKKTRGIISLVLCLTILGSFVTGLSLFKAKAVGTGSYEVIESIKIDDTSYKFKAVVSYNVNNENDTEKTTEPEEDNDLTNTNEGQKIIKQIEKDLFPKDNAINETMYNYVSFKITKIKENNFSITVTAPMIANELLEYSYTKEKLTDKQIEEKIISLIKTIPAESKSFTLDYEKLTDSLNIIYTDNFSDAITCEMVTFYKEAYKHMLSELEELR